MMHVHHLFVQAHEAVVAEQSTRERLIAAAERLFAERGIFQVSLREINRESGARNAVALQYHFGDREGLVRAILAKHFPAVDARRSAMLDEYEAGAADDLRALAAAWVRPLASKLSDPDGGPEYLQIYAELINLPVDRTQPSVEDSTQRWRRLVEPFLGQDATRLHRRFTVMRFVAAELGRRARSGPHADDRLFTSHLIDLVTALLLAPTSNETLRLADARDSSKTRR